MQIEGTIGETIFFPTKGSYTPTRGPGEDWITPFLLAVVVNETELHIFDLHGGRLFKIPVGTKIYKIAANTALDEMFVSLLTYDLQFQVITLTAERVAVEEPLEIQQPGSNSNSPKKPMRRRFQTEYNHKLDFSLSLPELIAAQTKSSNDPSALSPLNHQYYTSFVSFKQRPQKYFLIGTHTGDLLVFLRNGTFFSKINIDNSPIIVLDDKIYPYVLYATKNKVGLINPENSETDKLACETSGDEIIHAVADLYANTIFYALVKSGEILIYDARTNINLCRVISKRSSGGEAALKGESLAKLLAVKNHVIYHEKPQQKSLLAFNITDLISADYDAINGVHLHLVPKEESEDAATNYITMRNGAIATLIGAITEVPGGLNRVAIYELNIPRPPVDDWFSTIRLPIIIVSILLVFGYQIWYKKKQNNDPEIERDIDNFERFATEGKGAQGRQMGRKLNPSSSIPIAKRQLEQRLSEMDQRLGPIGASLSGINNQYAEAEIEDEDENDFSQDISTKKYQ